MAIRLNPALAGILAILLLCVAQLTRAADSPGTEYKTRLMASDPATWKPVPYQVVVPTGGVTLDDPSLFKPVMEKNIAYLLDSFSVNHMLVPFRQRAGQKDPPDDQPQLKFWDTDLRAAAQDAFSWAPATRCAGSNIRNCASGSTR